MYNLLQNEHFWVYLAFILFILIFGKSCYSLLKKTLDDQISIIAISIKNHEDELQRSEEKLKEKNKELKYVEQNILNKEKNLDNIANIISEEFLDKLAFKENLLEKSFSNYIKIEENNNFNKLKNDLTKKTSMVIINLLKNELSSFQKNEILNKSISELPDILKKININA